MSELLNFENSLEPPGTRDGSRGGYQYISVIDACEKRGKEPWYERHGVYCDGYVGYQDLSMYFFYFVFFLQSSLFSNFSYLFFRV